MSDARTYARRWHTGYWLTPKGFAATDAWWAEQQEDET